ncbi:transcriptional regulator, Sir2 family [Dictyocaulus viviparus]|uniref:Transcriptional regulator, Sir2 family n=1 Tax=Dictyocaulus viviparus TaxID=29172 RepID=A0A0D8XMW5_DICVI|nr:transcriptional regulator, Sir2 family [Dictyocaulus viviparus]
MSGHKTVHKEEEGTSRRDSEETISSNLKSPHKNDFYSRFIDSFQNALSALTTSNVNADGRYSKKSKLNSFSLEGIADYIKSQCPCNIIVMSGAGISTSSGIPDFRSPGSGLYNNLKKYNLPDAQAIFEISFFHRNPKPFFALAKELLPDNLKPTLCHYFVRLLEKKGLLRRWYTQNIDSLEFLTGMPEDKVVTAHGSFCTSTCTSCGEKYDLKWLRGILKSEECLVPICYKCKGVVKPDVTFFGESLPTRFFQCAISDFPKCDLLLIMGTSLVVQPFANLVNEVYCSC